MLALDLESETAYSSLVYIGESVVLESNFDKATQASDLQPHYFESKSQAYAFIIEASYALLRLGWRVYTHEDTKEE